MEPCRRVGLDVSAVCPYRCAFCFYRYEAPKPEPTFNDLTTKVDTALAGGLDAMVMVGYGEPSLSRHAAPILDYCHARNMVTSMITVGATGLKRFKGFFAQGMDHVLLSIHAAGPLMDEIAGVRGVFAKQSELLDWMASENLRFAANVSIFQKNYRQLPETIEYLCERKAFHVALLNHLPHYGLANHVQEIAVHPIELRPYIEEAMAILREQGVLHTLRYFPFCQLAPALWPMVMNARHVFFSPLEWVYTLNIHDKTALWAASVACGESVAVQGEPCRSCLARRHCGGWNRVMVDAFPGCVQAIREVPEEYREVWDRDGGLFDLNPANHETGTIGKT